MKEIRRQKKEKEERRKINKKGLGERFGPAENRSPRPTYSFPNRYPRILLPLTDRWAQVVSRRPPPSGDHAVTVSSSNFSLLNSRLNARQFLPPYHTYKTPARSSLIPLWSFLKTTANPRRLLAGSPTVLRPSRALDDESVSQPLPSPLLTFLLHPGAPRDALVLPFCAVDRRAGALPKHPPPEAAPAAPTPRSRKQSSTTTKQTRSPSSSARRPQLPRRFGPSEPRRRSTPARLAGKPRRNPS
jgi:hypothetical protein